MPHPNPNEGHSRPVDQLSVHTNPPVNRLPVQTDPPTDQSSLEQAQEAFLEMAAQYDVLKRQVIAAGVAPFKEISTDTSRVRIAPNERSGHMAPAGAGPPLSEHSSRTLPTRFDIATSRRSLETQHDSAPVTSHASFNTPQHPAVTFDYISVSNAGRYGARGDASREDIAISYERPTPDDKVQQLQSTPVLAECLHSTKGAGAEAKSSSSGIGCINDDLKKLDIRPIRKGGFVDDLAFTPSTAPEKVTREDHFTGEHTEEEFEMCPDIGEPRHYFKARKDVQGRLPLHNLGDREPWNAYETNVHAAHNEGFVESISQNRRESSSTLDTSSTTFENVEDQIEQSSWKRREMFSRLEDNRQKFLRQHAERTAALNGEDRGAQYLARVGYQSAVDFLMTRYDASVTGRRVAVEYEVPGYTPGTAEAQERMRNALADLRDCQGDDIQLDDFDPSRDESQEKLVAFLERRKRLLELRDDYQQSLPTLPQRVRPMPMREKERMNRREIDSVPLKRQTHENTFKIEDFVAIEQRKALEASWASQQEVRADEEYDTLSFITPDEVEHYFDKPNVRIGIYDKNELDYYIGKQWEKKFIHNRRRLGGQADYANLVQRLGMNEVQLDHIIETSRQELVKSGKLVPATPSQLRRTPSKSTSAAASKLLALKRRASTLEPENTEAMHDEDIANATNEAFRTADGAVTGTPLPGEERDPEVSRSGRKRKKGKLFGG